MNSIFIDSDILIDLVARRENYMEAAALLKLIADKKVNAYTTPIVLANVDYIITKYSNKVQSKKTIKSLRKNISVLLINERIVDLALESEFTDFEDSIQYYSAEEFGIDFIVTRNKKDYKRGSMKIVTAGEYLDIHEANKTITDKQ